MRHLEDSIDRIAAETGFSGVVRVDLGGRIELAKAYGFAHRGYRIPNTTETQFAIASGTKGFTALTVVSLFERVIVASKGRFDRARAPRSACEVDGRTRDP